MTKAPGEQIDDILTEVLPEITEAERNDTQAYDFTFAQSVSERRQQEVVDENIDQLAAELDIQASAVQMAKSLHQQYRSGRGDLIGTALENIAASCLYCAAKVNEVPLDPTDFVTASNSVITRKTLLRRSKDITSTIGLDPSAFYGSKHYVGRYCDDLELGTDVRERSKEIIEKLESEGISSGKSPSGWAAAAVYNACLDTGSKRTQTEVSKAANITEVTIRNRYQEQRDAIRSIESLPSDPVEIINYVCNISGIGADTKEIAEILIQKARDEGCPVEDASQIWALAAIWRGIQVTDEGTHLKTLAQYTDLPSSDIKSRCSKLRKVATPHQLRFEAGIG